MWLVLGGRVTITDLSEKNTLPYWAFLKCWWLLPGPGKVGVVTVMMLKSKVSLFMQIVMDGARTDHSRPGGGASSDCCWLKSVQQVCHCDVRAMLLGCQPRAPNAVKVRDGLAATQELFKGLFNSNMTSVYTEACLFCSIIWSIHKLSVWQQHQITIQGCLLDNTTTLCRLSAWQQHKIYLRICLTATQDPYTSFPFDTKTV